MKLITLTLVFLLASTVLLLAAGGCGSPAGDITSDTLGISQTDFLKANGNNAKKADNGYYTYRINNEYYAAIKGAYTEYRFVNDRLVEMSWICNDYSKFQQIQNHLDGKFNDTNPENLYFKQILQDAPGVYMAEYLGSRIKIILISNNSTFVSIIFLLLV